MLAVNEIDVVGHAQKTFDAIVAEYCGFASQFGIAEVTPIAVSALRGNLICDPHAPAEAADMRIGTARVGAEQRCRIDRADAARARDCRSAPGVKSSGVHAVVHPTRGPRVDPAAASHSR